MNPMDPHDNSLADSKSSRWYYFRDGAITGPTGLNEVLRLESHGHDGKETLVCRADFKKWYPLGNLSHLLKAQDLHGKDTAKDVAAFQDLVSHNLRSLETTRTSRPTVEAKTIGTASAPSYAAPKTAQPAQDTPIPEGALGYFLLKGRLRLGTMRPAFATAFLKGPFTCGIAWYYWLKNSLMELRWHASNDFDFHKIKLPLGFVAVPGLQLFFLWKLAKLLRTVEEQNNYHKTSPTLALLLSMFPPFAIFYLQRRINLHWTMHVTHYRKKQDQVTF